MKVRKRDTHLPRSCIGRGCQKDSDQQGRDTRGNRHGVRSMLQSSGIGKKRGCGCIRGATSKLDGRFGLDCGARAHAANMSKGGIAEGERDITHNAKSRAMNDN